MPKTCLDETGYKIRRQLYVAAEALGASPCLLAAIGSWGDTLDDPEVLAALTAYNEMGECFIPTCSVWRDGPKDAH